MTHGYLNNRLIGIYGDADPLDVTQWLPFEIKIPTDTRSWNDKTSSCTKVYAGLHIQLLVSQTGEKQNPQNKIVAAMGEIITSDWKLL